MRANLLTFRLLVPILGALLWACGPSGPSGDDDDDDTAVDAGPECTDNATGCNGQIFQTCEGGAWVDTQSCAPPTVCDPNVGCAECVPDRRFCDGDDIYECTTDGQRGDLVETCEGRQICDDGVCVDPCADAAENKSYIGCEYYAVDLDNAIEVLGAPLIGICLQGVAENLEVCWDDAAGAPGGLCDPPNDTCPANYTCQTQNVCVLNAQESPYAIVVSNPNNRTVQVTISDQAGTSQTVSVAADQVEQIFPQQIGFGDKSIDRSGISANAYHITSTLPIVAYQFNPLDNVDVFSNDGSLLIPVQTWDTRYYAMSYPTLTRRPGLSTTNDYNSYIAVVAWEDGTQVTVTPAANTRANGGFAAITAGTPTEFTLDAFEILHLEAEGGAALGHEGSPDLTGTLIESTTGDQTFGVFGGHEAIVIPRNDGDCCADHVEEMMFPTSTWGIDYALARSHARSGEADMIRVIAQEDATTVTFNPPATGTCPQLDAGEFCEVTINGDTEISGGDKPILVGHYLLSVITQTSGNGDPSMSLGVPTEQFRSSYAFLVPNQYDENWVSIVVGAGGSVFLDSNDISSQFATFGSGSFSAVRVQVQPGQHKIECPGGCGIEVYGYSDAVSYLFAGGLDLEQIVVD